MAVSAAAVGEGTLLSAASHQAQIAPDLLGFGSTLQGCPACHTLDADYNYGLGIVRTGSWLMQNPLFFGWGGVMAYLPTSKIAVAVVTTYGEQAFDDKGNYKEANASQPIFGAIASYLAPNDPPGASMLK